MKRNPCCPPEQDDAGTHVKTRMLSLLTRPLKHYGVLTAASYTALVSAVIAILIIIDMELRYPDHEFNDQSRITYPEAMRYFLFICHFGLTVLAFVSSVQVCRFGTTPWRLAVLPTAVVSSLYLLIWLLTLLRFSAISLLNWANQWWIYG